MSEPTNKAVFLSYASQDSEAARTICEALRSGGVEVWFDADGGLEHGDEWDAKIRKQIKECVLFIPVISANTQARHEGYFRIEWDLAAERARGIASGVPFILPVVIDDTREPDALVPDRFRIVQWTKLPGGEVTPEVKARYLKLWSHRTGVLKHEAGVAPASSRPSEDAGWKPALPRNRFFAVAWIAAVIALAAIVVTWRLWSAREKAPPATAAANSTTPAASAFPHHPDLKRARTLIYAVDSIPGDFALADDLVKPLLAAQPNDPEIVTVAAEVAVEYLLRGFDQTQSRRATAQRLAERAVQLAPDNPAALEALASYLRSARTQLGRAEELLRRALVLDPQEPRYYRQLYSVLRVAKPGPETEAFGASMAALFPRDPQVAAELTALPLSTGDLVAAEAAVDRTLQLAPLANAITWKAKLMLEAHGDVAGMKLWLDRMPERQRTGARLAHAYAVAALITGQTGPARRLLDAITDPWLVDSTYIFPKAMLLGDLDAIDGNTDIARTFYEAALAEIRRALAADPTDLRPKRAELWVQLGLGHRAEALAALRFNLQRRPNPYRWNLGLTWWTSSLRACLLLDERAEAMVQLREACAEPNGRLLLRNLFKLDPKMAPFRNDPEISALLAEPKTEPAASSAATPAAKSVAVLAFENRSDDKANEYFSDGIADELLTTLQKIPGLKIAAHASAWSFKGKNATSQEIGEKLGVAHVVEGSVQKSGNRVKITARLSRAATNEEIWSRSFGPLELTDVFATQSELAQAIVAELRGRLTGEASDAARAAVASQVRTALKGGTKNPEAHQHFLRGKFIARQLTPDRLTEAIGEYRRATELDPTYALGWAALADEIMLKAGWGLNDQPLADMFGEARREAERALALEPDLAEGHAALMRAQLWYELNWSAAAASARRALALSPANPAILSAAAQAVLAFGQTERGIELAVRAVELDPLDARMRTNLAGLYLTTGGYPAAEAESRRLLALGPANMRANGGLGTAVLFQGRLDEAATLIERETDPIGGSIARAYLRWAQHRVPEADAALREVTARADIISYQAAEIYAYRGDATAAFEWLDRAIQNRDAGLAFARVDRQFAPLHADPRWAAFLKKAGLSDEQLK